MLHFGPEPFAARLITWGPFITWGLFMQEVLGVLRELINHDFGDLVCCKVGFAVKWGLL